MNLFHRRHSLLIALSLVSCLALPASALAQSSDYLTAVELVERLRQGGHILYFRHAQTDRSQEDQHPVKLEDCSTQRNLSAEGRQQATQIGVHMKRLGIPIGKVTSSPYCRCVETAQLAFGRSVITDDNLYFAMTAQAEERQRISRVLKQRLTQKPAAATNDIIVSHTANLREATGIWPKPEGVIWVIKPDHSGGYQALGKIDPSEWQGLPDQ